MSADRTHYLCERILHISTQIRKHEGINRKLLVGFSGAAGKLNIIGRLCVFQMGRWHSYVYAICRRELSISRGTRWRYLRSGPMFPHWARILFKIDDPYVVSKLKSSEPSWAGPQAGQVTGTFTHEFSFSSINGAGLNWSSLSSCTWTCVIQRRLWSCFFYSEVKRFPIKSTSFSLMHRCVRLLWKTSPPTVTGYIHKECLSTQVSLALSP